MKCPFCEKEMKKGIVEVDYSLVKFRIQADYCEACKKMIFSANISG